MTLLSFERRWASAALEGFAPAGGPGIAPAEGEADYLGAMTRMMVRGTRVSALGLRLALYIATFSPMFLLGRLRTLGSFAPVERAALLARLLGHRVYAVRELVLLLKVCACLAIFRSPAMRLRSGYDAPTSDEDDWRSEAQQSGERLKTRLPIADAAVKERDEDVA